MRKKLIAGNWKMNLTSAEARTVVSKCIETILPKSDVEIVICPSYTLLSLVHDGLKNTSMRLGAQDVFWLENGAYTGQVSSKMLLDMGVGYCIIGHSEKRGRFGKLEIPDFTLPYFGETNETINLKVKALQSHYINPIICVGETLEEKIAGRTEEIIREQITTALFDTDLGDIHNIVIAYEPVWAIGTGKSCEAQEAEKICKFIRHILEDLINSDAAEYIRIIYGGSIKASHSKALFEMPNIDGGLIGGASLVAQEFCDIVMNI